MEWNMQKAEGRGREIYKAKNKQTNFKHWIWKECNGTYQGISINTILKRGETWHLNYFPHVNMRNLRKEATERKEKIAII